MKDQKSESPGYPRRNRTLLQRVLKPEKGAKYLPWKSRKSGKYPELRVVM